MRAVFLHLLLGAVAASNGATTAQEKLTSHMSGKSSFRCSLHGQKLHCLIFVNHDNKFASNASDFDRTSKNSFNFSDFINRSQSSTSAEMFLREYSDKNSDPHIKGSNIETYSSHTIVETNTQTLSFSDNLNSNRDLPTTSPLWSWNSSHRFVPPPGNVFGNKAEVKEVSMTCVYSTDQNTQVLKTKDHEEKISEISPSSFTADPGHTSPRCRSDKKLISSLQLQHESIISFILEKIPSVSSVRVTNCELRSLDSVVLPPQLRRLQLQRQRPLRERGTSPYNVTAVDVPHQNFMTPLNHAPHQEYIGGLFDAAHQNFLGGRHDASRQNLMGGQESMMTEQTSNAKFPRKHSFLGEKHFEYCSSLDINENNLPRSLEHIHISHYRIRYVKLNSFCGINSLADLRLTHCAINDDFLRGIKNLYNLTKKSELRVDTKIDPNKKTIQVNAGTRGCAEALRYLDLSHNEIQRLSGSAFAEFTSLKELHISHNKIKELEENSFQGLEALETLVISHNKLRSIHENLFIENIVLRKLLINHNFLHVFDGRSFSSLEELQILDLSNNFFNFKGPDRSIFAKLRRLVILNVSFNRIDELRSASLKGLSSLQKLDLSHNFLTKLEAGTFSNMVNLYELDLSHNSLIVLRPAAFYGLLGLSTLTLRNNQLKEMSLGLFQSIANLKDLDLSGNFLEKIPAAISDLSFLRTLDMSRNKIISLGNFSFGGMTNLLNLNLSYNLISMISSFSFTGLESLKSLDLSSNGIQKVNEQTFDVLANLESLHMSNNSFTNMNGLYAGMEKLLFLDLSYNKIASFDYAFLPRQLLKLNLKSNQIRHLGNFYKVHNFLQLTELDVSFNELKSLTRLSLPNAIERIVLRNNSVEFVSSTTFQEKFNLRYLDLRHNNVRQLNPFPLKDKQVQEYSTPLEVLLYNNELVCDCEMTWIQSSSVFKKQSSSKQLQPSSLHIVDGAISSCSLHHVHGNEKNLNVSIRLSETVPENFLCPYTTHCFALCQCCDFIACDCQMQCPHNCSCYRDHTWTTNLVDCSHLALRNLPPGLPMDATIVYLDGNDFKDLPALHFIGRHSIRTLYLNSSNIHSLRNRTFHGLRSLETLHLEKNELTHFTGFEFSGLSHLKSLLLSDNKLAFISNLTFIGLNSLKVLNLSSNLLSFFSISALTVNEHLIYLSLLNNPIICDCNFIFLYDSFINEHKNKLEFKNSIICSNYFDLSHISAIVKENCIEELENITWLTPSALGVIIACCCGTAVVLFTLMLVFVYRLRYSTSKVNQFKSLPYSTKNSGDSEYFDLYVCHSSEDLPFVRDVLVARFKEVSPLTKIFLSSNPESFCSRGSLNIFLTKKNISNSCRSMIVVTKNLLEHEWKSKNFAESHIDGFRALNNSIISLYLDDIPDSLLKEDIRLIISESIKIYWGSDKCWNELLELIVSYRLPFSRTSSISPSNDRRSNSSARFYSLVSHIPPSPDKVFRKDYSSKVRHNSGAFDFNDSENDYSARPLARRSVVVISDDRKFSTDHYNQDGCLTISSDSTVCQSYKNPRNINDSLNHGFSPHKFHNYMSPISLCDSNLPCARKISQDSSSGIEKHEDPSNQLP